MFVVGCKKEGQKKSKQTQKKKRLTPFVGFLDICRLTSKQTFVKLKAAFTRQTSVGQLVLANSNWCVCELDNNLLANCWRKKRQVLFIANSMPTC